MGDWFRAGCYKEGKKNASFPNSPHIVLFCVSRLFASPNNWPVCLKRLTPQCHPSISNHYPPNASLQLPLPPTFPSLYYALFCFSPCSSFCLIVILLFPPLNSANYAIFWRICVYLFPSSTVTEIVHKILHEEMFSNKWSRLGLMVSHKACQFRGHDQTRKERVRE